MPALPVEVTDIVANFQTGLEVFKGQLKEAFANVELTTVAAILLIAAGAVLIFDLLVYLVVPRTTARAIMITPLLSKILQQAWELRDEFGLTNLIENRSMDNFEPVLAALTMAAEKYDEEELQQSKEVLKED